MTAPDPLDRAIESVNAAVDAWVEKVNALADRFLGEEAPR